MGVLCVAMMFWTSQAEEAMKKGGIEGLRAFSDKLNKQVSISQSVGEDEQVIKTNRYLKRRGQPLLLMNFLARNDALCNLAAMQEANKHDELFILSEE